MQEKPEQSIHLRITVGRYFSTRTRSQQEQDGFKHLLVPTGGEPWEASPVGLVDNIALFEVTQGILLGRGLAYPEAPKINLERKCTCQKKARSQKKSAWQTSCFLSGFILTPQPVTE
jgi:hypothetical protein